MGQTNHLTKRGSVYWLRRRIPTDLLPHYGGKVEISFSLKTKDSAQAAILCRRESVRLDEEFARIRAEHAGTVPTDHDLVEVAGKIIAVPPPQGGWPAPETSPSGVSWEREEFEAQEEALAAQAQEEYAEAAADAAAERFLQALARRGVTLPDTPGAASQEAVVLPQKLSHPAPSVAPAAPAGMRLGEVIELWRNDRNPTAKTLDSVTATVVEAGGTSLACSALCAVSCAPAAASNAASRTSGSSGDDDVRPSSVAQPDPALKMVESPRVWWRPFGLSQIASTVLQASCL